MRRVCLSPALLGIVALLSGCTLYTGPIPTEYNPPFKIELARVDPGEAAERAAVGSVIGATLGTGLGAMFAINPAVGSLVGIEAGAAIGAAIGAATAQPLPDYGPVPAITSLPGFYDTWPPGYRAPPLGTQAPPPKPD